MVPSHETVADFIFLGSRITMESDCSHEIKRCLFLGRKAMTNLDSILKSRDNTLPTKIHINKAMIFSIAMWMWELDHKEGWVLKNLYFWILVLEKTLESPLDYKEIQWVHPKGDQSWIFTGRTDAEAPILWPPDAKSQLIGKDSDAWKDWGQEEKWATDDEIIEWHHWLHGHKFEQTLGDSERQGSQLCSSPWGRKESDTTEGLNNNISRHQVQSKKLKQ